MAQFTSAEKDTLNRVFPDFQKIGVGTKLDEIQAGQIVAYTAEKAASFSTAVALFTAPFAMQIVDVIVEALATVGSGTVKVMKATTEICTAIACAADGAVTHVSAGATVALKAHRTLAVGDVVNIQAAGGTAANIRGRVTVVGVRL